MLGSIPTNAQMKIGDKVRLRCQLKCCLPYKGLIGTVIELPTCDSFRVKFNIKYYYELCIESDLILVDECLSIPNSDFQYCSCHCGSITINKNQEKYICCQCQSRIEKEF